MIHALSHSSPFLPSSLRYLQNLGLALTESKIKLNGKESEADSKEIKEIKKEINAAAQALLDKCVREEGECVCLFVV